MGRAPCCDKANVKKGPWSPEEDAKLKDFIHKHGIAGNWISLPQKAGLKRCGKSCRLRWLNYLRPNIKHGEFSQEEDTIIFNLYATIGSRWSIIAAQLPGRTDNDIKNYWNTKLKKKLLHPKSAFSFPQTVYTSIYHKNVTAATPLYYNPIMSYSHEGLQQQSCGIMSTSQGKNQVGSYCGGNYGEGNLMMIENNNSLLLDNYNQLQYDDVEQVKGLIGPSAGLLNSSTGNVSNMTTSVFSSIHDMIMM